MPVPNLATLAIAAGTVASAIMSCSGNLATSTTNDAGPDVDAGSDVEAAPVGAPPKSALRYAVLERDGIRWRAPVNTGRLPERLTRGS